MPTVSPTVPELDAVYSGIYKIYCFDCDITTFLHNQFNRAYLKSSNQELCIHGEITDAVVQQ